MADNIGCSHIVVGFPHSLGMKKVQFSFPGSRALNPKSETLSPKP